MDKLKKIEQLSRTIVERFRKDGIANVEVVTSSKSYEIGFNDLGTVFFVKLYSFMKPSIEVMLDSNLDALRIDFSRCNSDEQAKELIRLLEGKVIEILEAR